MQGFEKVTEQDVCLESDKHLLHVGRTVQEHVSNSQGGEHKSENDSWDALQSEAKTLEASIKATLDRIHQEGFVRLSTALGIMLPSFNPPEV
jgi:hypothetical protein